MGGDFLFGRPGGPKAPPRVDFGSQKRQKKHPSWRPKSRFLASFFNVFFAWILHVVSVAILKDSGVPDGTKIHQKSLQNHEKIHRFLYASWDRFFLIFHAFRDLLEAEN